MLGFVGRWEHTLDSKGRVILPAKFREEFAGGGHLSQHSEGCVALWTPAEFEARMAAMAERAAIDRVNRNRARIWASNSCDVDVDRQGRMAIPSYLRSFAHLESDVLVIGNIDHVELWDPATWEERVLPEENWLVEDEGA